MNYNRTQTENKHLLKLKQVLNFDCTQIGNGHLSKLKRMLNFEKNRRVKIGLIKSFELDRFPLDLVIFRISLLEYLIDFDQSFSRKVIAWLFRCNLSFLNYFIKFDASVIQLRSRNLCCVLFIVRAISDIVNQYSLKQTRVDLKFLTKCESLSINFYWFQIRKIIASRYFSTQKKNVLSQEF